MPDANGNTKVEEVLDAYDQVMKWQPPGPCSERYLNSTALIRPVAGPYGSGKTTTIQVGEVYEAIRAPRCTDGVRYWRTLQLRDTYRELYKTTISTWLQWFHKTFGKFEGSQDRPAKHVIPMVDDFGPINFETEFAAIPDGGIKEFFDGFEPSSIFLNGVAGMPEEVLRYGLGRIGRYPRQSMLPKGIAIEKHVSMDFNKTDVDHWLYRLCVLENPNDLSLLDFIDMPGGMDPDAENRQNLNPTYYEDMIRVNPEWWVNINVHNKWGPSRDGVPVFDRYNDRYHLAPLDLDADPSLELLIGFDAGTTMGGRPAAVFFQVSSLGQVRVIDELYLGRCGPTRFAEGVLAKLDQPHLRGAARKGVRAWCDPSAFHGADREGGESTWVDIMERALSIVIDMPESNELEGFRLETVRVLLAKTVAEGQYGLLLSPRCRQMQKGFNSGYRYKLKETRAGLEEAPQPDKKSESSHTQDALQHGVTGYFGYSLVLDLDRRRPGRYSRPVQDVFSSNWDPFAV